MPTAPLRHCATIGCPELVPRGLCKKCRQQQGRLRRSADRSVIGPSGRRIDFYQSPLWKDYLRPLVRREEPFCRQCGRLTEHIDHIIPREFGGSDERENLQGLCASCHSAKTRAEMNGTARINEAQRC